MQHQAEAHRVGIPELNVNGALRLQRRQLERVRPVPAEGDRQREPERLALRAGQVARPALRVRELRGADFTAAGDQLRGARFGAHTVGTRRAHARARLGGTGALIISHLQIVALLPSQIDIEWPPALVDLENPEIRNETSTYVHFATITKRARRPASASLPAPTIKQASQVVCLIACISLLHKVCLRACVPVTLCLKVRACTSLCLQVEINRTDSSRLLRHRTMYE